MNENRHGKRLRASFREERVDPQTGRSLHLSKYADRHLLVMVGGDEDAPDLKWMLYDELASQNPDGHWLSLRMSKKFGLNPEMELRCWLSGVLVYLAPFDLLDRLKHPPTWLATREHLVCGRNGGNGQGDSNIVVLGDWMNERIGHRPLPLKLFLRKELAKRSYERDVPTKNAVLPIRAAIIEIEDQFRLGEHYPWQPWAFDPGTREHRLASAFQAEMLAHEAEFLALDASGRAQWLVDFRWRW